jgi:hypothetical protein
MSNVRFLDSVAVNSFANGTFNSTAYGSIIPQIILPGAYFTVSPNTSVSTYNLTVAGTLLMEAGPEVQLPDGTITRATSQLYVTNVLDNQGTIVNSGVIEIGV